MLKFLIALLLVLGFNGSVFAGEMIQTYECYGECKGPIGDGGTSDEEVHEKKRVKKHHRYKHHRRYKLHHGYRHFYPLHSYHPHHYPLVTCYTRNNYNMQFYGRSYNLQMANNIAFNICYQNSWYPGPATL